MFNPALITELKEALGPENVLDTLEDRICHSFDGTFAEELPDVVVLPTTTEAVSRVLQIAYREEVPVVPQGMGSGLAAGSVPFGGGIALSLTRMNRILEIDRENMTATAEAGVITAAFAEQVESVGLFYPPDPGSIKHSTLGGNVACNAGGPRCLKYGVTADYVMGLTIVLADGRVLRVGGKAIKNVTGYELLQLFVGSEGTLGVITEVLVKLIPKPRYVRTALAIFPRLDDASRAVNRVLMAGVIPATLELMDETAIACIEEAMHLGLPLNKEAFLLLEADGNDEVSVLREMDMIVGVCRQSGASEVRMAGDEQERAELWRARRSLLPSLARRAPNQLLEDVSVPRSEIPRMVQRVKEIGRGYNLPMVVFGHAGDGNLHPTILFDRRETAQWVRVQQAVRDTFAAAVEMGGTLSGEHGIGTLKRDFMELALGTNSVQIQRQIKRALDPKNILNPGKMLPGG
ncbi:MAG: FAD-binding oxidoreductase [Anaerolineae bacterium]